MKFKRVTYGKLYACFFEAMRVVKGRSEWTAEKEGNALIDASKTHLNYELVPHHPALNPSARGKKNKEKDLIEYHKSVCGKAPRMNGKESQQSKAVGLVATLPKEELSKKYELTDAEYDALEEYISSKKKSPEYESAMKKMKEVSYTEEELEHIHKYFDALYKAWKEDAGIRDEDVLYAVVHLDESTPHLHIMALPTTEKENGRVTFSVDRFRDKKQGYIDGLHERVIEGMKKYGVDGKYLLNGKTKGNGFVPADLTKAQREESLELSLITREIKDRKEVLQEQVSSLEEEKGFVENEIAGLEVIKNQEVKKGKELATAIQNGQARLEASKIAYEGFKKEQGEEMVEFFEYRSNQAKYKAKKEEAVAKLEAKEQRIQNQCVRLEGQRDALKEDVKELAKEIGDVGSITRAVHNISNTEKEVQNYDDMMLFARVAMNFLERKFPKILQEILNIIEKARGISARKNIIETMQKEAEADVKAIEEEWDLDR